LNGPDIFKKQKKKECYNDPINKKIIPDSCQARPHTSAFRTCIAASTLAPPFRSSRTTSTWPFCAATMRHVMPFCAVQAGVRVQIGQGPQGHSCRSRDAAPVVGVKGKSNRTRLTSSKLPAAWRVTARRLGTFKPPTFDQCAIRDAAAEA
jgi:hypothetical protein